MPTRIGAGSTWMLFAAFLMISCSERGSRTASREIAQRGMPPVFSKAEIVIIRLDVPVDVPVASGTVVSSGLLESDTPSVVSVDANEKLVAHLDGRALVRMRGSSAALIVRVAHASSIRIAPPPRALRPGGIARVEVLGDGGPLPSPMLHWQVTHPEVAIISQDGEIEGRSPGRTDVVASYGDLEARAVVEVLPSQLPTFSVHPQGPRISVGGVLSLQALSGGGPIDARWTTSSSRTLAFLGGNLFRAISSGSSEVYASAGARRSCTTVEVAR